MTQQTSKPINVAEFLQKWSQLSAKNEIQSQGNNIVMLVGDTGVGKTTILNMINGSSITACFSDEFMSIKFIADPPIAKIGHLSSETFEPNYLQKYGYKLYDNAGSNDTRGPEYEIVRSISAYQLAKAASSVKLILVSDFSVLQSNRMGTFQTFLRQMENFVEDMNFNSDCSIIITKTNQFLTPNMISNHFKNTFGLEIAPQKFILLKNPVEPGPYDYSHINFQEILHKTPSLYRNYRISLSDQAKNLLYQLNIQLNQQVTQLMVKYNILMKAYFLQIIGSKLQSKSDDLKEIYQKFTEVAEFLRTIEDPKQFVQNIRAKSVELEQIYGNFYGFQTLCQKIEKNYSQIAFIQDKINSFKCSIVSWRNCMNFDVKIIPKSNNKGIQFKLQASFTQYLNTLNIDLSKNIKDEAHCRWLSPLAIRGEYSGNTPISGYLSYSGNCYKTISLPFSAEINFAGYCSYSGYTYYNESQKYEHQLTLDQCQQTFSYVTDSFLWWTTSRRRQNCRNCSHGYKYLKVTGCVNVSGSEYYKGDVYYSKRQNKTQMVSFTESRSYTAQPHYSETVPYKGQITAPCQDHHRCSCKQLAQIILNAKELFEDNKYYKNLIKSQQKIIKQIKDQTNLATDQVDENSQEIESANLNQLFDFTRFQISEDQADQNTIISKVHQRLSQPHTFKANYSGSNQHYISRNFAQSVNFSGSQYFTRSFSHSASVPYSTDVPYSGSQRYSGQADCNQCYNSCSRCDHGTYKKSYSGDLKYSGTKRVVGTTSFSKTQSVSKYLYYNENLPVSGTASKYENVPYSGSIDIICKKTSQVGDGHHNCDSCSVWQKFVRNFQKLLQVKEKLASEIQRNNNIIKELSTN